MYLHIYMYIHIYLTHLQDNILSIAFFTFFFNYCIHVLVTVHRDFCFNVNRVPPTSKSQSENLHFLQDKILSSKPQCNSILTRGLDVLPLHTFNRPRKLTQL